MRPTIARASPVVLESPPLPPLPHRPGVSLIVCAYSEERLPGLTRLVERLRSQTCEASELLLVVDGNPALAATARERFADVSVVENHGARGHAGAANRGLAEAHGDIVVFIDDDAEPADDRWLEWLVSGYEEPDVLGVGGPVEPRWLTGRPPWYPEEFLWIVGGSHRGLPATRGPVRNLWMGNMSIRRVVLDGVGGFRTSLSRVGKRPFGVQETELCIRASQLWPQGRFLFEPRARVRHDVPAERATFAYFRSHCFDEGRAKASMCRYVGSRDGLAAEREYVTRLLPAAVARGLADAVTRGDRSGLRRSGAIAAGTAAAACGYLRGRATRPPSGGEQDSDLGPVRLHEVELSTPLPALSDVDPATGARYARAQSLVRLHTYPLGLVELELPAGGIGPDEYADRVWRSLRREIESHLERDGMAPPPRLPAAGLGHLEHPACQEQRRRVLADAPFVSVVVPTRDGGSRLEPCLRALLASEYPSDRRELLVVDNLPQSSETADLIERQFGDGVRYLREDAPGSASARNRGLAEARGQIVAFLDDDAIVDRYWLVELAKGFSLAANVGCVTELILPLELETPAQLWFEEYGGASKGFERRIFDLHEHRPDDPLFPFRAGRFGSGGSMAFERAALRRLGGFDPALGNGTPALGGVDLEMFLRTIVEGYTLVYEPAAIVRHSHLRDAAALRERVYAYGVGLTALLVRSLVAKPSLIPAFLRALPAGLAFGLGSSSAKHAAKSPSYPRELRRAEIAGMARGPFAYWRSARQLGRPARIGSP